jgi:hypothetical protein
MDKYFVPLKEGRRAKGAGQAPHNYVCTSRIPKKKFVAKQFASAEICREAICSSNLLREAICLSEISLRSNLLRIILVQFDGRRHNHLKRLSVIICAPGFPKHTKYVYM